METEIQGYLTEFGILRGQIRDAIKGMGDEAANWRPLPQGTNSVYAILSHIVGVDNFWVRQVITGEAVKRDREAEFAAAGKLSELVDRWAGAWAEIESILSQLSPTQLMETRTIATRPEFRGITVQWIILHLISHYATHLGHIQLTAQLWDQRPK
jgi:uncharacterized damage-inducible protein DinB